MKRLFFAFIICSIIMSNCMSPEERKKEKEREAIQKIIDEENEFVTRAYVIAQDLVSKRLKAPSTAKFPKSDYTNGPVINKSVEIKSYVDSQNAFGAMIRTNYSIRIKQTGDDWADTSNWQVVDFTTN